MYNPNQNGARNLILQLMGGMVGIVLLTAICFLLLYGVPVRGMPKVDDIVSAQVTLGDKSCEVQLEDMQIAADLAGGLKCWFGEADQTVPEATITYQMKDGSTVVVGADADTIYKDGTFYAPKGNNGELFYNVVEGIFFS